MARSKLSPASIRRVLNLSERLYRFLLCLYPANFRSIYGSRMVQVFRDSCRDSLQRHSWDFLMPFWMRTLSDLVRNACLERWQLLMEETYSMESTLTFPLRLWITFTTTVIVFIVSLLASINFYLIEDSSRLTQAAYTASPLLRFSYDGIYLSVLVAGVAMCAVIGYTFVRHEGSVVVALSIVTLLTVLGGFGGLIVHHIVTFLIFFVVFLALTLSSLLFGRAIATHSGRFPGQRPAAVLGACVSVGCILLVNIVFLVLHTLVLNPVSHALYMQGLIEGTHLNFSLIAMGGALLSMIIYIMSLGYSLCFPQQQF